MGNLNTNDIKKLLLKFLFDNGVPMIFFKESASFGYNTFGYNHLNIIFKKR